MTDKLLHWSQLWHLMDRKDQFGELIPFQMKFVKLSTGEVKEYKKCYLTSFHSKGSTINVIEADALRPRKIRRCLIIEFNHHRVYI